MPGEKLSLLESLLMTSFASLGGALSYMMRTLNREETPTLGKCLIEALSSGFVGALAMLACKALGLDWYWSGVIVGVFGWVGAEASIAVIAGLVRKRLGVDINATYKDS